MKYICSVKRNAIGIQSIDEIKWWCQGRKATTKLIAHAMVYTEAEKNEVVLRISGEKHCFVPLTNELILKGVEQLNEMDQLLGEEAGTLREKYKRESEIIAMKRKQLQNERKKLDSLLTDKAFSGSNEHFRSSVAVAG